MPPSKSLPPANPKGIRKWFNTTNRRLETLIEDSYTPKKDNSEMSEVKLNIEIPKGYEATGEYRIPKEGEFYLKEHPDGNVMMCESIHSERHWGKTPFIILKKKEPFYKTYFAETVAMYGAPAEIVAMYGAPMDKRIIEYLNTKENQNAKYKITIEEI